MRAIFKPLGAFVLGAAGFLSILFTVSAAEKALAGGGVPLHPNLINDGAWTFENASGSGNAHLDLMANIPEQTLTARSITLRTRPPHQDDVQLRQPLSSHALPGEVYRLCFWARSTKNTPFRAVFDPGWTAPSGTTGVGTSQILYPVRQWREYGCVFQAPPGIAPSDAAASVVFHLGLGAGRVDLSGIRLEDYGVAPVHMPAGIVPE